MPSTEHRTYRGLVAPLREIDPVGIYHVMSRGNYRGTVFYGEGEYSNYLTRLQRVSNAKNWTVLDWCLIPNHVHLVVQLTDGGLSEGMRELNGGFSRWHNARTGRTRTGHLWKNRFRSLDLANETHFREVLRYVPANPVRHGLVRNPEDWPWSGYRATIGLEYPYAFHQTSELLRYFGSNPATARRRYKAFVSDGLARTGHVPWSDEGYESRAAHQSDAPRAAHG